MQPPSWILSNGSFREVHSENVKCYRNIQDLFNEFDSKIEKMDEMEKSVGAVKDMSSTFLVFHYQFCDAGCIYFIFIRRF